MASASNCPSGGATIAAVFCTSRSSRAKLTAAVRSSAAAAAPHLSTVSRSTSCRPATAASRAALSSPGRLCSQPSSSAVNRSPAGRLKGGQRGAVQLWAWWGHQRRVECTSPAACAWREAVLATDDLNMPLGCHRTGPSSTSAGSQLPPHLYP